MKLAGIMSVRNYNDKFKTFQQLKDLCDVLIVLEDDSASFPYADQCDDYIRLRRNTPWNNTANLTMLLYRSFVHECDWVLNLDHDITLSAPLRFRHNLDLRISQMETAKCDIGVFPQRELWNSVDRYRADGVWSFKQHKLLRRVWIGDENITLMQPTASRRLHTNSRPANKELKAMLMEDHLYHTGCLTKEGRIARVEKYAREDPGNVCQPRGYGYTTDEVGLYLKSVPLEDLELIKKESGL